MSEMKRPNNKEYLAGVIVANSFHVLYFLVISFIYPDSSMLSPLFYDIGYFIIPIGVIIAAYFVSGRATQDYILVGGITGVLSFITHFIIFLTLFSWPRMLNNIPHNFSLFVVFIVSGNIGGALRK